MSKSEGYSGWSSYATWRINLEICDDELQFLASDGYRQFRDEVELADYLKEVVENAITEEGAVTGLAADYALAFANDVNFYEIAKHAKEDYPEMFEGYEADDEDGE